MKLVIPTGSDLEHGPVVEAPEDSYEILGGRGDVLVVCFHTLPANIAWFDEFEHVLQT